MPGETMPKGQKLDVENDDDKMMEDGREEEEERAEEEDGQIMTIADAHKKKPLQMWKELLQFIRRMEMADWVSLVCYGIKELCWPRMYGNEVRFERNIDDGNGRIATITNEKEPIWMSIWVWEAVLQFITRMEMAERHSLVCHYLKKLCWPRLHGDKVTPHMVGPLLFFSKNKDERGRTTTSLAIWENMEKLKMDQMGKKIPIATGAPPPDYILGFKIIGIGDLDAVALQFLRNISPLFANNNLYLQLLSHCNLRKFLDAQDNGCCPISFMDLFQAQLSLVALRQYFPGLLENMPAIYMIPTDKEYTELDALIFAKIRKGKQFVLRIVYVGAGDHYVPIADIQKIFQSAIQPKSSFMISFLFGWGPQPTPLPVFRLENEHTGEVLAQEQTRGDMGRSIYELYRCPGGEEQKWREQANKLLEKENYACNITL